MTHSYRLGAALLAALTLSACGDKADDSGAVALEPTYTNVYAEVLEASCTYSSCHLGTGSAQLGWDDADGAYAALVGQPSSQVPALERVSPGDPDNSYLVLKLHGAVGIVGGVMPPDGALPDAQITLVQDWISAGAAND